MILTFILFKRSFNKLFFNKHDVRIELLKDNSNECKIFTGYEAYEIKELLYNELNTRGELNWRTFAEDLLKEKAIGKNFSNGMFN